MTKTQITQRVAQFERVVMANAKEIAEIGNASWDPIKETAETPTIRTFLSRKGAGLDYLNRNLAPLLSKNGRVVKFAGLFLHGTPMVRGWTTNKAGHKQRNRSCELADLMTVFLYVDRSKTIKRMRCVLFQAKMMASKGNHVVDDPEQRKLYDDCHGFDYENAAVATKGESRMLPKGSSRKKALQFMFVEPRPVETRTIPSDKDKGETLGYGAHLVRFLNGKTGLASGKKSDSWSQITTELMEKTAEKLYSDGQIKGPGITDLLGHFNSFEDHRIWCVDDGEGKGLGVELVIVWDSEMGEETLQVRTNPKAPVSCVMAEPSEAKKGQEIEQGIFDEDREMGEEALQVHTEPKAPVSVALVESSEPKRAREIESEIEAEIERRILEAEQKMVRIELT